MEVKIAFWSAWFMERKAQKKKNPNNKRILIMIMIREY